MSSRAAPLKRVARQARAASKANADGSHTPKRARSGTSAKGLRSPLPPRAPPPQWRETFDLISELRKERDAPVDYFGCHALADATSPHKDFHVLVALLLSSQTRDQQTALAMENLKRHGLSVENVMRTEEAQLRELIKPVGFYNRKATYLKGVSDILHERHGGAVPGTLAALLELPGIGPKMSFLALSICFDKPEGIAVDTHVHQIANKLGWARNATNEEHTRVQLQSWMPEDVWGRVNLELVGLGQMIKQPDERGKLLKRCLALAPVSRVRDALRLVGRLGLDVRKVAEAEGIDVEASLSSPGPTVPSSYFPVRGVKIEQDQEQEEDMDDEEVEGAAAAAPSIAAGRKSPKRKQNR